MNAIDLKNRLLENIDELIQVLEYYGFYNIRHSKDYIFFGHSEDSSPNGCSTRLTENLYSRCYSKNIEGDVFSFIMQMRNLKFYEVIKDIKKILNIDSSYEQQKKPVFNGFFKQVRKNNITDAIFTDNDKILTDEELQKLKNGYSYMFLRDHISLEVQKEFNIGYDLDSHRISVNWLSYEGECIGVMGRLNYEDETQAKWLPIYPFSKSKYLYGYSENYQYLYNNRIYIGESEKFVLQMASYKKRNAVALGCSSINDSQIKMLLALNPAEIVFCFDEGLDPEAIKRSVKKLIGYLPLLNIRVGVMLDSKNQYLPKGSKASPSDFGKAIFEKMENECIKYIKNS